MLQRAISGQFCYFTLVSAISGNVVTGASGQISGRKLMGSDPMAVLSGNIIETSGGTYRANLFDWDTSGNNIGLFFTASGCVPVMYNVTTIDSTSGRLWPASGVSTLVYSGQLSGHAVDLLSGRSYTASGIFATATATVGSGSVYLASGHFLFGSGQYWLASGNTVTALSGDIVVSILSGTLFLASGQSVTVYSGQLSGHQVDLLSGRSYIASGVAATVPAASISGVNTIADVTRWKTKVPKDLVASGHVNAYPSVYAGTVMSGTASTVQLAGSPTGTSGILDYQVITIVEGLAKGQSRLIRFWGSSGIAVIDPPWNVVPESSTEFYVVTPTTLTASGVEFPSLPKAALSGVVANSGLFVTATLSGQTYLASGSIFGNTFASGVTTRVLPEGYLKVDQSGITGEAARSPLNALRKLNNKWDAGVTASGVLTVFKEDDSTTAYTQNIGATSGASPVTSLDTN